jgi:hypothetical protein
MKYLLVFLFASTCSVVGKAQDKHPSANVRLSFLLFPFSPLLTVEVKTIGNLTLQAETNFIDTHGLNLKYYLNERMNESYVFVGTAFVTNSFLRKDLQSTTLPYIGYGYAYRFGNNKAWTFDSRFGIGSTINADKNSVYPVIKTGIGRVF